MMGRSLTLESFEEALVEDTGPDIRYEEGYAAGLAAGEAAVRAESATLDAAFVQSVADIEFTYAEARGQILKSLVPLFNTIAQKILPHCVELGFSKELETLLTQAADAQIDPSISLTVNPSQSAAAELAAKGLSTPVKICTDSDLPNHAAWIAQGVVERRFDANEILEQIQTVLGAVETEIERNGSDG